MGVGGWDLRVWVWMDVCVGGWVRSAGVGMDVGVDKHV